jgi:hypothetical protein
MQLSLTLPCKKCIALQNFVGHCVCWPIYSIMLIIDQKGVLEMVVVEVVVDHAAGTQEDISVMDA